ncbi:hydrolase [Dactylosporangium sp. NPDC048998]|uniref:hydrolase n=1 Tax=Dactylosporangium sp. NPDC048998 TaxID=3363976 RepID=UPI003716E9BF
MLNRALLAAAIVAAGTVAVVVAQAGPSEAAVTHRVLFDNSKAETAGNADWIISTSQPDPLGQNPAPTTESSWTGALSSWGVALQRTGEYSLKTLPAGNTITYGGSGALDLKNFDEFVMPEPNAPLSAAEKTAIMRFIQAGGGFFLIVDHTGSDRNNDGWDSVRIANDLMTNNGVNNSDPFGFSVDVNNIGTENPVAITSSTDPVINGPFGKVRGSIIRNGSTQTLRPADNATVKGLVYRTGFTPGGTTGAFFTTSTFGAGRVAVWGDSSPIDDGTGQPGNTLYDGWNDTAGTNAALALNATAWLAGSGTTPPTTPPATTPTGGTCPGGQLFGNPGFETGAASPWTATSGVVSNDTSMPAHGGSWKAWLDGYGAAHTDTLSQTVTIPAGCTRATLSFWLRVATDETTTTTAYDTLTVAAGSATLATYSNLDASTAYRQRTLTVTGTGSVKITFTGVEGSKLQTSFLLDDLSIIPSS